MNRRIFVDVTRTARETTHTGIQKVVRSVYRSLAAAAPERGAQVIPVILDESGAYRLRDLPSHPYERNEAGAARHGTAAQPSPPRQSLLARLRQYTARNETRLDIRVIRVFVRLGLRPLRHIRRSIEALRRGPPVQFRPGDVLLLPDSAWSTNPWPVVAGVKAAGGRIVTIWYDIIPITHPDFFSATLVDGFRSYLDKTIAQADSIVCISQTVCEEVRAQAARLGPRQPHVTFLYPVVQIAQPAGQPRPELESAFDRATVLIVATIEPRKGHALLLDACDRLWRDGIDFNLLVIGRVGWQVAELMARLAVHPERTARLRLIHDASDADVAYALGRAALMVFPSRAEGLGLPILEAEMAGCPTLCSDIPVFREIASPVTRFFSPHEPEALAMAMKPLLEGDALQDDRDVLAKTSRPDRSEAYAAALLDIIDASAEAASGGDAVTAPAANAAA